MTMVATNPLGPLGHIGPGQRAWGGLALTVLTRAYRAFLITLAAVAVAPIVWGWSAYTVRSASMEPSLAIGDVVVARPVGAGETVPVGRVMFFTDPSSPDRRRLLVHRVVERLDDGTYVTAGDANASTDSTPVPTDAFQARAVLLAPYVGLPVVWARTGRLPVLLLWALLTVAAFARASGPRRGARDDTDASPPPPRPAHHAAKGRRALPVALLAVALAATATTTLASAAFTSSTTNPGNTWAVALDRYFNEVRADGPHAYYRLDEAGGATMADSGTGGRTGSYAAVSAYHLPGAMVANPGYAVSLAGQGRLVSGGTALTDPTTFSLELWFKTTTTAGGKLIGFESTRNATSASADRHVLMRPDGRLVYGAWDGSSLTIVSPKAYNDGQWHHLVLTAVPRGQRQDAVMYVDGGGVVLGTTTRTGYYSGWWRVGYGTLVTGPGLPSSASFTGAIDEVAVYPTRLSATRVSAHYAAR